MQRVFISYSRKDIDFARKLAGDLEKAGFEVWWDISDLKGGDDWVQVIPAAIESSRYFIILLSPDSVLSQWVEKEYLHALKLRMKILPVMIRPCTVPFALANINYLDFTASDPLDSLNKLLADLEYNGEPVHSTALSKKALLPLPPALARFETLILAVLVLGILLLSFFVFKSCASVIPSPTPTFTPTATQSLTMTPTRDATSTPTYTVTLSPTVTPPLTSTDTLTPENTVTPSPTKETMLRVELCIRTDFTTLVRTGPGKTYGYLSNPLKGDDCLLFSARSEDNKWYMIAPRQPDARFREFEYGWVSNFTLDLESAGFFSLPVGTPMPTATRTPSPTYTATITPTWTFTPTLTSLPTDTNTPNPTDTRVPTSTVTDIPTLEPTPIP
jgi:hypothetical protein